MSIPGRCCQHHLFPLDGGTVKGQSHVTDVVKFEELLNGRLAVRL